MIICSIVFAVAELMGCIVSSTGPGVSNNCDELHHHMVVFTPRCLIGGVGTLEICQWSTQNGWQSMLQVHHTHWFSRKPAASWLKAGGVLAPVSL